MSDRVARVGRAQLATLAKVWRHGRVSRLQIAFNVRLRSTVARWVPPSDVLEIGSTVMSRDTQTLREIIAHEAAHVVVWDLSGRAVRPRVGGIDEGGRLRAASNTCPLRASTRRAARRPCSPLLCPLPFLCVRETPDANLAVSRVSGYRP